MIKDFHREYETISDVFDVFITIERSRDICGRHCELRNNPVQNAILCGILR